MLLYILLFHSFFSTAPLPLWVWGIVLLAPWLIFAIEELCKWQVRRGTIWLAV